MKKYAMEMYSIDQCYKAHVSKVLPVEGRDEWVIMTSGKASQSRQ